MSFLSGGFHEFLRRRGQTSSETTTADTLSVEGDSILALSSSRGPMDSLVYGTIGEERTTDRELDRENSVLSVSSVKLLSPQERIATEKVVCQAYDSDCLRCTICPRVFKRVGNFRKHMASHTEESVADENDACAVRPWQSMNEKELPSVPSTSRGTELSKSKKRKRPWNSQANTATYWSGK